MQQSDSLTWQRRYRVNVLMAHDRNAGAPVVAEDLPTYDNLVGRVEHRAHLGALETDLTMVRPGALDPARFRQRAQTPWPSRRLPLFTLPRSRLVGHLLRQHYFSVLFRACAESLAAEHGSRLNAMQAAEKNLDERMENITSRSCTMPRT